MCGRYALYDIHELLTQFNLDESRQLPERYNIAPGQIAPVIKEVNGKRALVHAIWGLKPSWATEAMPQPINAKVETAAEKPFFRNAWKRSRIIIPANGYYEWKTTAAGKQPYFIYPTHSLFGFAGLLEYHEEIPNFTILTSSSNTLTKEIHDRMPVILEPENYAAWLNTNNNNNECLKRITRQYPDEKMQYREANKDVGNAHNEGRYLISNGSYN